MDRDRGNEMPPAHPGAADAESGPAEEPRIPGETIIIDTWRLHDSCRDAWVVKHGPLPDARASNAALARMLELTLRALAPLARPVLIGFGTLDPVPEGAVGHRSFRRAEDEPSEAIIGPACAALAAFPYPVYNVDVPLELRVWLRTDRSPDEPERVWVWMADELRLRAGMSEDEGPDAVLLILHTLFHPVTDRGEPNDLHPRNHPVLVQVLRAWDRVLGPVQPLEPWAGITPFGYDAAGF